jgi:DNA polymerase-3 subunit gamma/tau
MSYQVLARKYRPRIFREMIGQEHVLRALINALDHNRLHHAYLFTGTRGVGKTTIARILAKCLNCETGVSSEPCGECSACREIAEGRFVDLIEVDAASRTKVEDTRELLDNVQYAPSRGRYKIYLIDEVHMLSNHSFNALLKTLEEPPEHIKFLLATTDPQKLPVTILSRCLQFNLKNMNPERIVQHLQDVLAKELVPFEEPGLWQLARAADGSMRDALSLTDQAISYGGGKIADHEVSTMLGTIDHQLIQQLMQALVDSNGAQLLASVAQFSEQAPDFQAALADLLSFLHRIAIAQALPEALDNSYGDRNQVLQFASQLAAEDVQLFYQTALIGRRDLPLAPNPRNGFEMTLLRMLAFRPQGVVDVPTQPLPDPDHELQGRNTADQEAVPQNAPGASAAPSAQPDPQTLNAVQPAPTLVSEIAPAKKPPADSPPPATPGAGPSLAEDQFSAEVPSSAEPGAEPSAYSEPLTDKAPSVPAEPRINDSFVPNDEAPPWDQNDMGPGVDPVQREGLSATEESLAIEEKKPPSVAAAIVRPASSTSRQPISLETLQPSDWQQLFENLAIKGLLSSTVANCVLVGRQDNQLFFALDESKGSLFDESHSQRLGDLISDYFGQAVKVRMDLTPLPVDAETPAMHQERIIQEKRAAALHTLQNDPVVQQLERDFNAQLQEESVTFTH